MSANPPILVALWRRLTGRGASRDDPYGQWYVDKAYVAAEVELDIGIVTTALILIYQQNVWLALGTFVGFLILEFLTLAAIAMAENVVRLRRQLDILFERNGMADVVAQLHEVDRRDDADPFKLVRIIGISAAVIGGIVLVRGLP